MKLLITLLAFQLASSKPIVPTKPEPAIYKMVNACNNLNIAAQKEIMNKPFSASDSARDLAKDTAFCLMYQYNLRPERMNDSFIPLTKNNDYDLIENILVKKFSQIKEWLLKKIKASKDNKVIDKNELKYKILQEFINMCLNLHKLINASNLSDSKHEGKSKSNILMLNIFSFENTRSLFLEYLAKLRELDEDHSLAECFEKFNQTLDPIVESIADAYTRKDASSSSNIKNIESLLEASFKAIENITIRMYQIVDPNYNSMEISTMDLVIVRLKNLVNSLYHILIVANQIMADYFILEIEKSLEQGTFGLTEFADFTDKKEARGYLFPVYTSVLYESLDDESIAKLDYSKNFLKPKIKRTIRPELYERIEKEIESFSIIAGLTKKSNKRQAEDDSMNPSISGPDYKKMCLEDESESESESD